MKKTFDRLIIIMLENAMRSTVLANNYFKNLRKKGVFLPNAQGNTHPSQPNYITLIAGDNMGITDDEPHYTPWYYTNNQQQNFSAYTYNHPGYKPPTIVDLLEAHNLSWKCYVEDLPTGYKEKINYDLNLSPQDNEKNIPPDLFPYVRKHVPFLSFPNIVANPNRLANIVRASNLEKDLKKGQLPHYNFYVPNQINNGHSISSTQDRARNYDIDLGPDTENVDNMAQFVANLLGEDPVNKFPPQTLIVLTFDESYPYPYDYTVYTMLFADFLQPGTIHYEPVNLYTLLRSVEDNFGIGTLGRNDVVARPYWFLQ